MAAERAHLASLVDDFERKNKEIALVVRRGLREQRTTYAELASLARRFASDLIARGIGTGDRVLVWGENGPEWIAAFFGCVLRGVLPVPLDLSGSPEFAAQVAREVSPKLIVADQDQLHLLASPVPSLVLRDLAGHLPSHHAAAAENLSQAAPLQIIFTSGTTGYPKGVLHTHKNVLASLRPIETEIHKYLRYEWLVHPLRILHTLPLSHVFGQFMGLWVPSLLTAEVHFESRLVAADLVERIRKERISVLASVPRVLDLMQAYLLQRIPNLAARLAKSSGLNAWQRWWQFRDVHRLFGLKYWAFVCGGASLSPGGEQFWGALGFVVVQGYGMTETTALVSLNHPFRAAKGTIGQVLPGREVRLNPDGELLVRGDTISNATWQDGHLHEGASEWLATGDLAEWDQSGNLRFRGRKKDVIVTSAGLNIHPDDLEAALNRQPAIKVSTVVETISEAGPEPLAILVVNGTDDAGAAAGLAIAAANGQLAAFQQIRHWLLWPEPDLPRTSTGKVLRREVSRRIAEGEVKPAPRDSSPDGDLNLDSLGRLQLQAQLEAQHGISLDDAAIQCVKTGEDVRRLVAQASVSSPPGTRPEHFYPRWPWNPFCRVIRSAFLELAAMPLVSFLANPRVTQHAESWPASPVLIVANHVTSYDAAFILYALPGHMRRHVAVAMSGEMLLDYRRGRNQGNWCLNLLAPIAYLLITALFNVFPLPQVSGFRRSFRHAGEAVDAGYSVVVFPEGRRADDESPQPFKSGVGLLWKELGIPAIPIRLRGLGELKAHRRRWFRSGTISVSVGPPCLLQANQSPEELTETLRRAVFDQRANL